MSYEEYYNRCMNDEEWIENVVQEFSLSLNYPRYAKYVFRTQAYWEWRRR